MRNKKSKKVISKNRPFRRRRNKSAGYINIPLYIIIVFFVSVLIFSVYGIFLPLISAQGTDNNSQAEKKSSVASKPSVFPLFAGAQVSIKPSPTITPKPTEPVIIPTAQVVNDYCLNVPVLLYHHVQPLSEAKQLGHAQLTVDSGYFDSQMAYLAANGYHSLSADDLSDALINHHGLPAKPVLVTLDDGYDDNFNYAFQILKKYNIAGNFMIPTGLLENKGYMTWNQLKEIAGNSLMHVYNHTWSHSSLAGDAKDKIEYEITTANGQLESNLGKRVRIFTYPYGSYSPVVIGVLREHGFTAAFSTINGTMQCQSFIFELRRTHIGNAPLSAYGL